MVQICFVRLLQFLKLQKVVQVSFAEYHSKRYYVERVHAVENEALSKHGPFSSTTVHENARTGSNEHKQNMEAMATEVAGSLSQGMFRGRYLQAYRGVSHDNYVFDDEATLKEFLALSEDRQDGFNRTYHPIKNRVFQDLMHTWECAEDFDGKYKNDYHHLQDYNKVRLDKYTTIIYSSNIHTPINEFRQPIPDYLRWMETGGELHYFLFLR